MSRRRAAPDGPSARRAPLLVTRDRSLLDELLRLAAAAGVTPEAVPDAGTALRPWAAAPMVLVGTDLVADLAALAPQRRGGVLVVGWDPLPQGVFSSALALGAEGVLELPSSTAWLGERLTDLEDQLRPEGRVVGVVGGSGGAGATTFACALGQVAARTGSAVIVDLDPWGPGLDRLLGAESLEGVRWDALHHATGRIGARSLRQALPRRDSLAVLTWQAGSTIPLSASSVRDALASARRGHDLVVVDLPRSPDALVREVVDRCDALVVVVAATVPGVSSAARVCARYQDAPGVGLLVRAGGVPERDIADVTGLPVLVSMPDQRGLREALDLGLGPARTRRGPLARAASLVLDGLAAIPPAA